MKASITIIISVLITFLIVVPGQAAKSNPATQTRQSTAELEALRDQIRQIKNEISKTRGESDELRKKLEQSEAEAEKALQESKALDEQIRKKNESLESLKKKQTDQDETLNQHQEFLKQQIRLAYINRHHGSLRLVSDQQDPGMLSRNLVYHRYMSQARAEKIANVSEQITEIQSLQQVVATEAEQLRVLKALQKQKLQSVDERKQARAKLLAQLDKQLTSQSAQLMAMQRDADKLTRLIQALNKAAKRLAIINPKESRFDNLKGKLRWPATGAIIHAYGSPRNGSSLTWQGTLIKAAIGSDVKAISDGRIIFSDWFQNLGRLIIVDHGDSYMSLYGHNQELFRSVGDKVKTGEIIASVGNTGGRKNSGLYFEVRRKGTPVNPATWCKGNF